VNASIGLTADANRRFNAKRGFLGRMKGVSTGAAITTAALASVLRDRGRDLQVAVDGWPLGTGRFRNLAFVKNPTFAGCLSYGRERVPPAGSFGFHAVDDVSLAVLLRILAGLARGRFPRRRSTHSRNAITAEVWGGEPFAVEFDGEVTEAVSVLVSLVPRRLEVCA
jgi:diacylglycerol kinase family enzyme